MSFSLNSTLLTFFIICISSLISFGQNQYNLDSIRQEIWKETDAKEKSILIHKTIRKIGFIDSLNSWKVAQWLMDLADETQNEEYRAKGYSFHQEILRQGAHLNKSIIKGEETAKIYQRLLEQGNLSQKDSFEYLKRMAYCYGANSSNHMRMKNYVDGVKQLQQIEEIFIKIKDTFNIARCYNDFGMFYKEIKQYDKALKYFTDGLTLHKNTKDLRPIAVTKSNIASLLIEQGKLDKAEKYVLEILELIDEETLKNSFVEGMILETAIAFYKNKNELKLEKKYLEKTLKFYKNAGNSPGIATMYLRMFKNEIDNDNPFKAKDYLDKATTIAKKFQEVDIREKCNSRLADYFIYTGQYSEAEKLIKDAQVKSKSNSNLLEYAYTFAQMAELEKKRGNPEGVFENLEKNYQLKDSMLNETVLINQELYEVQYETEKKEQEIALLTTKEKAKATQLNYSLGIGGLLLLLLGLLFNRFREKNKTNQLLEEKNGKIELLLKEIHHRVKNNLQTISSLLFLQSAHIKDAEVKEAVAEGQHRVESMALIHQKLYQRDNLAAIEMKDYLTNLGNSLIDTFVDNPDRISLKVEMDEHELDVDTAVPLGLIANELITNSIKYAFPDNQQGEIKLKVSNNSEGQLELFVSDNGIGAANKKTGTSFGSQLINLLTKQLNGTIEQGADGGFWTRVVV